MGIWVISIFKGALSGLSQFLAIESPLKMMKDAFYFTSKALFVLKIFKFWCLDFLVKSQNGLFRKIILISILWRHNVVSKQVQYKYFFFLCLT